MKTIQNILVRFWLYNKRLLKKPLFSVLLVLTVILVILMSASAEGGVVRIALASEAPDLIYDEITADLMQSTTVISFFSCETPSDAEACVRRGDADAAWIFSADLSSRIDEFVGILHNRYAFVTVLQREDSVLLQLTHEKLNGALYPYLSRALYNRFLRTEFDILADIPRADLLIHYDAVNAQGEDMFQFSYIDGSEDTSDIHTHYLLSPIRGLLSVMIVIGGLATSIFYLQDEAAGRFDWIPRKKRLPFSFIYTLTAVFDLTVVSVISLIAAGLSVSVLREILLAVLYMFSVTAFCVWLRVTLRGRRVLGMLLPLIVIAMITLCPVFFSLRIVPFLQQLLPPYLYLNSVHNLSYAAASLCLGLLFSLLAWGCEKARDRLRLQKS